MQSELAKCKLCGSVHSSFPSLWAHYRTLHQTATDSIQTKNASLYDAPGNVCVDRLYEESGERGDGVETPAHGEDRNAPHIRQPEVAHDVLQFFEGLSQHSSPLISEDCAPSPTIDELPPHVALIVNFCMSQQISIRTQRSLYNLITDYDDATEVLPAKTFSKCFPSRTSFIDYINRLRQYKLVCQGWRRAHIHVSEEQVFDTGLYRTTLTLAVHVITAAGGCSSILPFAPAYNNSGERSYSNPLDGRCYEMHKDSLMSPGKILLVDIYSDGLSLPNSGTQSVTPLRMRFPNIRGRQDKWYNFGIEPLSDDHGMATTRLRRSIIRREVFQRFIFMALQDMIHASRSGLLLDGHIIYPRLHLLNLDQKEERRVLSLRGARSYRSCSQCDIRFSMPTNAEAANLSDTSDDAHPSTPVSSHADLPASSHADQLRQQHLKGACGSKRLVGEVVQHQLLLAKLNCNSKRGSSQKSDAEASTTRRRCISYLKDQSALDFPPALAAFVGSGSKPFHLYDAVSYDKLHGFDLGILRNIMEGVYNHFKGSPSCTLSTSSAVTVVNK